MRAEEPLDGIVELSRFLYLPFGAKLPLKQTLHVFESDGTLSQEQWMRFQPVAPKRSLSTESILMFAISNVLWTRLVVSTYRRESSSGGTVTPLSDLLAGMKLPYQCMSKKTCKPFAVGDVGCDGICLVWRA